MTVNILKSTFSRGELSPKTYSRVDLELYEGGAEIVRNFYNVIHGGLRRRSGTRYAGTTKYSTGGVRFIPFVYNSTGQAYVLEFGHEYIRFWRDGGQIFDGESPYEVTTDFDSDDIALIQFAQTGDTMMIACDGYYPQRLVRYGETSWTVSDVPFVDGPYYPINDTDTTADSDADLIEGNTTTVTFSSTAGVNGGDGFTADDVGRHIRLKTTLWAYGVISAVTSTTVIDVDWVRVGAGASAGDDTNTAGSGHAATKSWRLGSFADSQGYPKCVAFYDGRLVWASTYAQPRTVFISRSGLPFDYAPSNGDGTTTAEHGFAPTILAGLVDSILWLSESSKLLIGTSSGVRTIAAGDSREALANGNVSQKLEIYAGCNTTLPMQAQEVTVYAERYGNALRNIYFSFEQNSLIAPSFTELSDHLFKEGVAELAYQQVPEGMIWVRTADGMLRSVTYNREEKVIGFARHDFGDTVSGNGTEIKTMACVPGLVRDEVWMVAERTINESTVRYVEYIEAAFEYQDQVDAFFVDCGLTYDGSATDTVTGLDHLIGEEVAILADGAVLPRVTVDGSGNITLPNGVEASVIHVGLPMMAEAKLLRSPFAQEKGAVLGKKQRAVRVITEVLRTGGLKAGIEDGITEFLRLRQGGDNTDEALPLWNGPYNNILRDSWIQGGQVYWSTVDPLPAFIRSALVELDAEEE